MSLDIALYFDETVTGGEQMYIGDGQNITHNLGNMWEAAGVYDALYESAGQECGQFIPTLETGLADMKANPDKYKAFNAKNGWGLYEHAVPFLEKWIETCKKYPKAKIWVSR
jgi:hypothetical protein